MAFIYGCSSYRKASLIHTTEMLKHESVGLIGCPAEELTVKILKDDLPFLGTWKATCRGKIFFCSRTGTGAINSYCKPELK